jgi:hypothetical protein
MGLVDSTYGVEPSVDRESGVKADMEGEGEEYVTGAWWGEACGLCSEGVRVRAGAT